MQNEVINSLIENNGEEFVSSQMQGVMHEAYSENFISDFINTFEDTKRKKTTARKKAVKETDNADPVTGAD
jgi:hypothetical protein